mmetsp:Transcript_15796/g.64521  ORF Transcript_15796/g.64521 Transcript_15796/m.64521 type:complete len:276 (+) Transcript_15796:1453-2280(+)
MEWTLPPWGGEARMMRAEQAPRYLRREWIESGYRVGGGMLAAARSLFTFHNETVNAWTMVFMSDASTLLLVYVKLVYEYIPLPFALLWMSVVTHMPFSVALHLFIGISENSRRFWRTCDVFFMQFNSLLLSAALAYYVMDGLYIVLYATSALFVFLRSVYVTTIRSRIWRLSKPQLAREMSYLVISYCSPLVIQGVKDLVLSWNVSLGVLPHVIGIIFSMEIAYLCYSKHLPEKWSPGRFDLVGNSHQIMHVMGLVAHLLQWAFLLELHARTYPS